MSEFYDFRNPEDLERFELERAEQEIGLRVLVFHVARLKNAVKERYAFASRENRFKAYKLVLQAIETLK